MYLKKLAILSNLLKNLIIIKIITNYMIIKIKKFHKNCNNNKLIKAK